MTEMNRLQEAAIERLALAHGRVAVRDGYEDHRVRATVPSGAEFHVTEEGVPVPRRQPNLSVRWPDGAGYWERSS